MKRFFYTAVCILFFACGTAEEKQENILPRQTFVSLLIRMHILDARISFTEVVDPRSSHEQYAVYDSLLKQYQTDSATLSRTFDHYRNRQDELLAILQEVQDSLVAMAQKTVKPK